MYAHQLFANRYSAKAKFTGHVSIKLESGSIDIKFNEDEIDELTAIMDRAVRRHKSTLLAELSKDIQVFPPMLEAPKDDEAEFTEVDDDPIF